MPTASSDPPAAKIPYIPPAEDADAIREEIREFLVGKGMVASSTADVASSLAGFAA
jgi:hypothetical protein